VHVPKNSSQDAGFVDSFIRESSPWESCDDKKLVVDWIPLLCGIWNANVERKKQNMNQHTRYFNSSSPMLRIVFFMLRRIVGVNKLVSPFSFKSIQKLFCTFDQASSRCYQQQCRKVLIIKKQHFFFLYFLKVCRLITCRFSSRRLGAWTILWIRDFCRISQRLWVSNVQVLMNTGQSLGFK
jgi:hypothetical protein